MLTWLDVFLRSALVCSSSSRLAASLPAIAFQLLSYILLLSLPHRAHTEGMCGCEHRYPILLELYSATNGPTAWKNRAGWSSGSLSDCSSGWYGVSCDGADVTSISLARNNLNGTLPASFGTLNSLTALTLSANSLRGSLPQSWSAATSLEILALDVNQFTGTLPPEWAAFVIISSIDISRNQLTGTLPAQWRSMQLLHTLYLYSNSISGTLPEVWGVGMKNVQLLWLYGNSLSGTLPSSWSAMTLIEELSLGYNTIGGTLPPSWSSMTALRDLFLGSNDIRGSLPTEWSSWISIEYLRVWSNRITGSLPASWSAMVTLTTLEIQQNLVSGTLPPEWTALGNISTMDLSNNQLIGPLPQEWANMSALTTISLRSNLLTGTLPESWSVLAVTTVDLSSNMLQGSLPAVWYKPLVSLVSKLSMLNISYNCLKAPIPQQWTLRLSFWTLTIDNCHTCVFLSPNTTATFLRVLCRGRWPAHCDTASASLTPSRSPSVLQDTPTAFSVSAGTKHLTTASVTFAQSTRTASAQVSTSSTTSQELPQEAPSSSALQLIIKAPIVATSFISVMAGAEMGGSAQALLAVLDSPCRCSVIDDGSRANTQNAATAALSPLLLFNDDDDVGVIGPFEVALGNVGISALILLLNFVVAALHGMHRRRRVAKSLKSTADAIKQPPQMFTFQGVAFSPSGAVCRFPSLGLKFVTFLVPGMAWAVAQLASSYLHSEVLHQGNARFVTTTATELAVGVLVVGVFLCALAVFLKHVILDQWIEQQGPNKNKGGGLVFESFDDWNPFSPPIPRQLASIVCSRSGQWSPTDRRRAFGSPVANAFLPSCVRWAWAVSPAVSLVGVALSSARPATFSTATTVCDGLQTAQVILFCGGAMTFAIMLPHRSILRSLLATFSGLTNTFVVLLGLLCRHRLVNVDVPLQVSAVGAYVSLVGSIALFSLDKFEARVLATTRVEKRENKRRKQTQLLERTQCGNMPVTRSPLWLSQQAALKSLLCIICTTTSNPSAQNMY